MAPFGKMEPQKSHTCRTMKDSQTIQQGCETDQRNVARNNQDQKLWQTLKTLSKQDLYIIEISHRPYLDQNNQTKCQKPIKYIDISSPFQLEHNLHQGPRTGEVKSVHWQDEGIREDERKPLVTLTGSETGSKTGP